MKALAASPLLVWGVGPIAIAALTWGLAELRARPRETFLEATESLPASQQKALESAPALSMANAIWALGSVASVKTMVRTELDRLPESEGPSRARVYLRFGILDSNPDGQAAVFFQACAADHRLCDHEPMKQAAEREVQARFVAPGNVLPLSLLGGHPPIPGAGGPP